MNTPTDFAYELKSVFSERKRSPGFGFGERFKRSKHTSKSNLFLLILVLDESPPPDSYSIPTCFDGTQIPTSFKNQSSRQNYSKVYVPGYTMKSPEIEKEYPGPAEYNLASSSKGKGLAYTLHPRVRNLDGKQNSVLIYRYRSCRNCK